MGHFEQKTGQKIIDTQRVTDEHVHSNMGNFEPKKGKKNIGNFWPLTLYINANIFNLLINI